MVLPCPQVRLSALVLSGTMRSVLVPALAGALCSSVSGVVAGVCALLRSSSRLPSAVSAIERVDQLLAVDRPRAYSTTRTYCVLSLSVVLLYQAALAVYKGLVVHQYVLFPFVATVTMLTLLQFFTLVLTLRYRFHTLNRELVKCLGYSGDSLELLDQIHNCGGTKWRSVDNHSLIDHIIVGDDTLCARLLQLQVVYKRLTQLASSVNDMYAVPIVALVVQDFAVITGLVFHLLLVAFSDREYDAVDTTIDQSFMVLSALRLVCLASVCQTTSSEAVTTVDVAEELLLLNMARRGSPAVSRELRQLSRQARLRPVTFSACSLFTVDAGLLTTMAATILTYTVILLQFIASEIQSP
ncbi:uncharacterized protein LOC126235630 [Schistocerca nitens]|uniref:uncharacterized protein LOC126235630 n=1 Tax=Schistocerca nitens TaxID=7011 RepID=UPI00211933AE|nr:uncharacterized protein LOC126235630 [Schistocerca nitens]